MYTNGLRCVEITNKPPLPTPNQSVTISFLRLFRTVTHSCTTIFVRCGLSGLCRLVVAWVYVLDLLFSRRRIVPRQSYVEVVHSPSEVEQPLLHIQAVVTQPQVVPVLVHIYHQKLPQEVLYAGNSSGEAGG